MRYRFPRHLIKFRTIKRDGEKRVIPIVERKRIIQLRGARHGVLPKYDSDKIIPRVKAAKLIRHDTVLELNAGTGTVSAAYKFPKKTHILVDKYAPGLETAKRKLRNHPGEVKTYAMNNARFIRKHLAEYQGRITLLDVDPYGCPGETLQLFFKHYQVDRPMIVKDEAAKMFGSPTLSTLEESEHRAADLYFCSGRLAEFLKHLKNLGWEPAWQDWNEFPIYKSGRLVAVVTGEGLMEGGKPYRPRHFMKVGDFATFAVRLPDRVSLVDAFDDDPEVKRLVE
ncbi:MAG: hypothetical protein QXE57_05085 [Nitrososphaerales archaeon]